MMKLKPIPASELNTYVVDLLANRAITTVREFLSADIDDIAKITNLSKEAVRELRTKVVKKNGPKTLNALDLYNERKSRQQVYGFKIENCDKMLDDQKFRSGDVFEIYGEAGIGKTQLCLTIALNIVSNWNVEALYIDTKRDFSPVRIMQMMRSRNMTNTQCGHITQRIKVERTWSLKDILHILSKLYELLVANNSDVSFIKLVVIDALPASWFTQNADGERFERKSLICQIAKLVLKLSQRMIAVLLVNLAVCSEELFTDTLEPQNLPLPDIDTNMSSPPISRRSSIADDGLNELPLKPTLGRDWIAVPRIRLLLKMPEGADEYTTERTIEVTRNSYGSIGSSCRVYIKDSGVLS